MVEAVDPVEPVDVQATVHTTSSAVRPKRAPNPLVDIVQAWSSNDDHAPRRDELLR